MTGGFNSIGVQVAMQLKLTSQSSEEAIHCTKHRKFKAVVGMKVNG
jgi:hypothetical protein